MRNAGGSTRVFFFALWIEGDARHKSTRPTRTHADQNVGIPYE